MATLKSARMNTVLAEQIHTEPVLPKSEIQKWWVFYKVPALCPTRGTLGPCLMSSPSSGYTAGEYSQLLGAKAGDWSRHSKGKGLEECGCSRR